MSDVLAFIGGGNMASAIFGGLVRGGRDPASLLVVEPHAPQREKLAAELGIEALPAGDERLREASTVVWAVKPQLFGEAAAACQGWLAQALQLSVMAGVRSEAIARASGSARVVRSMPNTPALIGQGIAGLHASAQVSQAERKQVEQLLAPTGRCLWVPREEDLDAVTAISGSGPAYFFYIVEALERAGQAMGLAREQARELALATCAGAAALALQSGEDPALLRERVTSKGGTTHAAISSLEADGVGAAVERAARAAQQRARELGDAFGATGGA